MKKAISILLIFITFLIIYFLQANFFTWFTIAGIEPNIFIVLVLFISLYTGMKVGIGSAVIFGAFLDIVIGKSLGPYILGLGLIAFLGGYFEKNFSKDSRITIMLMVMGSTCVYEIVAYIFNFINLSTHIEIMEFIKILLIEVVYNTIITIILYPLIQKAGYTLEGIFKESKILTRYF